MFKVLYYYYYVFYTKALVQSNPHFVTKLGISAVQSFFLNGLLDVSSVTLLCQKIDAWVMISVSVLILIANFSYFNKNIVSQIITNKPMLFNNHRLTILFVILVSVLSISWLFWGSYYSKHILAECSL